MLRRPGPPLALAALSTLLLAVTGIVAALVPVTQQAGFVSLHRPAVELSLNAVAHLADPAPYALGGLLLALVAALRRRWRVAAAIPLLFVLTGLTTAVLKPILDLPGVDGWLNGHKVDAASWPSGHATAAMTMALCAVLASPARLRPTVGALGGAFAIAVAYALLVLGWHFPFDVVGGYLVAGTYVLLALSALGALERARPTRPARSEAAGRPRDLVPALAVTMLAAGAALGLAIARPHALAGYAASHTTFVAGALAIAGLAVVLAVLLVVGVRAPARTRS